MRIKDTARKLISGLLISGLIGNSGLAAEGAFVPNSSLKSLQLGVLSRSNELPSRNRGSEFISGDSPATTLMQINLWGGVGKPGIHHVPITTDLITLLSYAGGPTDAAMLDQVFIRRRKLAQDGENITEERLSIDVKDLLKGSKQSTFQLETNDIVIVPVSTPIISQNTANLIGFVGSVLSIVLVGFVLNDRISSK